MTGAGSAKCLKSSVVVVDDDELVLASVGDAFAGHEFYVVEAINAAEALEILSADGENIEVLFSDIHMPGGQSGVDLAREVQEKWPWIQIILSSGHPQPNDLPAGVYFVQKPCNLNLLLPLLYRADHRGV